MPSLLSASQTFRPGPFCELIAEQVEELPRPARWTCRWQPLGMGLRDGLVLVLRSLLFTIPLLVAGFVPVVGQTVMPVALALVTAWFLALELVAVSFYRRGMNLTRRGLALGLGLPASLLCAIPFAAIVVMPVAFVRRRRARRPRSPRWRAGRPAPESTVDNQTVRTVAIIAMSSCSRLWQCMTNLPA